MHLTALLFRYLFAYFIEFNLTKFDLQSSNFSFHEIVTILSAAVFFIQTGLSVA